MTSYSGYHYAINFLSSLYLAEDCRSAGMKVPSKVVFQSAQSHVININVIMKTMCPPGYHHSDPVATHQLGNCTSCAQVYE